MHGRVANLLSRRSVALAGVIVVGWLVASNEIGISVALPEIDNDLALSHGAQLWVIAAYLIPLAGLSVIGGRIADLTSRMTAIRVGGIAFVLGSLGAALATGIWVLVVGRIVQGVAAVLLISATRALIVDSYDRDHLGRTLGLVLSVAALGVVLSPAIMGLITTGLGWRWVFIINALTMPFGVVAATIRGGLTDAAQGTGLESVRWTSPLLFSAALITLTATLFGGPDLGVVSIWVWIGIAVTAGLFVAFARSARDGADSLIDIGQLASRRRWTPYLVVGHSRFLSAWLMTVIPIYLQVVAGLSAFMSGVALIPLALSGLIARAVAGPMTDRLPWKTLATAGLTIAAAGLAVAGPLFRVGDLWAAFLTLIPAAAGSTVATLATRRLLLHDAPKGQVAEVSGLVTTATNVMGLLGLVVVGGVSGYFALNAGTEDSAAFLETSMEVGLWVVAVVVGLIALSIATLGDQNGNVLGGGAADQHENGQR